MAKISDDIVLVTPVGRLLGGRGDMTAVYALYRFDADETRRCSLPRRKLAARHPPTPHVSSSMLDSQSV